ncbi:hypothetical protein QBC35DRAFT_463733 [Podospora australis]|uniref:Uncharacterized protein n=1 Tax=Podospora australis TaxID=1536484 RepID=A0AAN6WSY1_9PEZI|nr:hypothetical protein QBC35DRAFT_463733 [Podospora australis]
MEEETAPMEEVTLEMARRAGSSPDHLYLLDARTVATNYVRNLVALCGPESIRSKTGDKSFPAEIWAMILSESDARDWRSEPDYLIVKAELMSYREGELQLLRCVQHELNISHPYFVDASDGEDEPISIESLNIWTYFGEDFMSFFRNAVPEELDGLNRCFCFYLWQIGGRVWANFREPGGRVCPFGNNGVYSGSSDSSSNDDGTDSESDIVSDGDIYGDSDGGEIDGGESDDSQSDGSDSDSDSTGSRSIMISSDEKPFSVGSVYYVLPTGKGCGLFKPETSEHIGENRESTRKLLHNNLCHLCGNYVWVCPCKVCRREVRRCAEHLNEKLNKKIPAGESYACPLCAGPSVSRDHANYLAALTKPIPAPNEWKLWMSGLEGDFARSRYSMYDNFHFVTISWERAVRLRRKVLRREQRRRMLESASTEESEEDGSDVDDLDGNTDCADTDEDNCDDYNPNTANQGDSNHVEHCDVNIHGTSSDQKDADTSSTDTGGSSHTHNHTDTASNDDSSNFRPSTAPDDTIV